MQDWLQPLTQARLIDLSQSWYTGMPHYPTHPPFLYSLTKLHGEFVLQNGASSAADAIALGTHTGTHVDALCHYSRGGRVHGEGEIEKHQSYAEGIGLQSIDAIPPFFGRGVLLDIAALQGVDCLAETYEVTVEDLEAAEQRAQTRVEAGDVVLVRTGWARHWDNPKRFLNGMRLPGPALAGAQWLSSRGIRATGSDTATYERMPSPEMEVHVHMLVERGIHLIECLNLEELSRKQISEFLFVASPLKIRGATASPIRPFAVVA